MFMYFPLLHKCKYSPPSSPTSIANKTIKHNSLIYHAKAISFYSIRRRFFFLLCLQLDELLKAYRIIPCLNSELQCLTGLCSMIDIGLGLKTWEEKNHRIIQNHMQEPWKNPRTIKHLLKTVWQGLVLCSGVRWYGVEASRKSGWIWSYWTREVPSGADNLSICVSIVSCKTINCNLEHLNLSFRHLSHLNSIKTVENIDYFCPITKKSAEIKGAQRQAVELRHEERFFT